MFCRKEKLARDVTTTQAPAEVCKACGCFVSPTYAKRVVFTNTRWGYDSVEFFCKQDAPPYDYVIVRDVDVRFMRRQPDIEVNPKTGSPVA